MSVALVKRMKLCPDPLCEHAGQPQPWGNFGVRSRWEDGTVRNVAAYCKVCHNRRNREDRGEIAVARAVIEEWGTLRDAHGRDLLAEVRDRIASRKSRVLASQRERHARYRQDPEWVERERTYQRERTRERYQTDPEFRLRSLAARKRSWERIKADPERHREFLDKRRMEAELRRGLPLLDSAGPRLDVGSNRPIGAVRALLNETIARIGRDAVLDLLALSPSQQARAAMDRRLYAWLNENEFIREGAVDYVGCQLGNPRLLDDLYPVDGTLAAA